MTTADHKMNPSRARRPAAQIRHPRGAPRGLRRGRGSGAAKV